MCFSHADVAPSILTCMWHRPRHAGDPTTLNDAYARDSLTYAYIVHDYENNILMQTIVPEVANYGARACSLHFDGLVATLGRDLTSPGGQTFEAG